MKFVQYLRYYCDDKIHLGSDSFILMLCLTVNFIISMAGCMSRLCWFSEPKKSEFVQVSQNQARSLFYFLLVLLNILKLIIFFKQGHRQGHRIIYFNWLISFWLTCVPRSMQFKWSVTYKAITTNKGNCPNISIFFWF